MPLVRIKMLATSATAERVLHQGKTYVVDEAEALPMLEKGSGMDGKPAAELSDEPATKITKPDPGEEKPEHDDEEE